MEITGITGDAFKDWVIAIIGNVFMIILVVRSVGYYMKREWGELIGHLLVAVVVASIVYFPDQFIGLLQGVWNLFTGGN